METFRSCIEERSISYSSISFYSHYISVFSLKFNDHFPLVKIGAGSFLIGTVIKNPGALSKIGTAFVICNWDNACYKLGQPLLKYIGVEFLQTGSIIRN